MDVFNPDMWKRQWEMFVSAPYIMLPLAVGAGLIGWWLRGMTSERKIDGLEGKIAGLNERIVLFEDRLKFAAEKVAWASRAKDEVEGQFQTYKAEVAANAGYASLAATAAKIDAAINNLSAANKAVSNAIGLIGIPTGEAFGTPVIRLDNE
jgi:hypothetical protein